MIQSTLSELQTLLTAVPGAFARFSDTEATAPRPGGKWSKLQLLGHLCDSAINNLSRFIKVQYEPQPLKLNSYNQNEWMAAQQYANAPREEVLSLWVSLVLSLWVSLNQSVLRVISNLSPGQLSLAFRPDDGGAVSLEWLIEDYLAHLKHHLGQIFTDQELL